MRSNRTIWVASENETLLRLWPVIEAQITVALAQDQAVRPDWQEQHSLHEQLVATLLTRDPVQIEAAFARHTLDRARELIALLKDLEPAG